MYSYGSVGTILEDKDTTFVSSKPIVESVATTILEDARTPRNPPRVIVESASAVPLSNRSPRTTGLLLALKDVIGDPDEDIPVSTTSTLSESWSESLSTLVSKDSFEQSCIGDPPDYDSVEEQKYSVLTDEICEMKSWQEPIETPSSGLILEDGSTFDEVNWTAASSYTSSLGNSTSSPQESVATLSPRKMAKLSNTSNDSDGSLVEPISSFPIKRHSARTQHSSCLLSPIELSTLDLGPFRQSRAGSFIPIPEGADWKQPSPLLPTPPRSPSIASTMAEVLASPFGPHATRILSTRLSVFLAASPNLSGIASPQPQQEVEPSDLDLDSLGEHSILTHPPMNIKHITHSWNNRVVDCEDDGSSWDEGNTEEDFILEESSDTSIWDSACEHTSSYLGVDAEVVRERVTDAIKRANRTPTHFLSNPDVSFDDDIVHFSLGLDDSMNGEDDCIALPKVLSGPGTGPETPLRAEANTSQPGPNDSLYDIYSGFASPQDILTDSIRNARLSPLQPEASLSDMSTVPISSRERVFIPQPSSFSLTAHTEREDLTALPATPLDSASGRHSPPSEFGHETSTSSVWKDSTKSRKVSIASRNRLRRSQNISTNQRSNRNVQYSPRSKDIEASPSYSVASSVSSIDSSRMQGLKPLRLSTILNSRPLSRSLPRISASFPNNFPSRNCDRISNSSASVPSSFPLSNNQLLSSVTSSIMPLGAVNHSTTSEIPPISAKFGSTTLPPDGPLSAPLPCRRDSIMRSCRLSDGCEDDEDDTAGPFKRNFYDETIRRPIPVIPRTASISRPSSCIVETTRPTLMFAIASDDPEQVKKVLGSGGVNPNEAVGPHSALDFALTNDKLTNKLEIVKALLAYGADPESVKKIADPISGSLEETTKDDNTAIDLDLDHATRYYLERAEAMPTKRSSALIQRSFFCPLTRIRYELVGQDRALEQLFRVLSMRSRELIVTPIVVMLCGPSGHGKSLLARKFGSLLEVPTHTVNMTTLRSSHDLWQSCSMSPEEPSNCTLAEFLINNEGRRCVVILDEIEKTADEKILWSLYLPWELGRCAVESSDRQLNVQNVIWLGTSNIGNDLIFQFQESRRQPEEVMSREEYLEVMGLLRPKVSERLGASVLSRVSTVLPFVPFTLPEKKAICTEALYSLGSSACHSLSKASIESIIDSAISDYYPVEGARSLHRAISSQLLDLI